MLTHLIILLDETSVSYCHYEVTRNERRLIDFDDLKAGIRFAMKENLNIQFVYPDYKLPVEYLEAIESIDHAKVMPSTCCDEADVVVLGGWDDEVPQGSTCIIRTNRDGLANHLFVVRGWLNTINRLNIVLTDVEVFKDDAVDSYRNTLESLADIVVVCYKSGRFVQLNLLTDRLQLTGMNNCNAGVSNVTLAPNGRFYLCPAFYYDNEEDSVGDLKKGLDVKNQQLLRLDHAPLCRQCDAYQCKRCIWQNQRLTLEANTPSHQQCVMAHVERNASRQLLAKLKENGVTLRGSHEIEKIDYLDPFNILNKWK